MSVLVDTLVWSLGLRRKRRDLNPIEIKIYHAWEAILKAGDAVVIGMIRQETLSGIASAREFVAARYRLDVVPDLALTPDAYVLAAEFYNICRTKGVAPGAIDMTICAAASTYDLPIFTTDPDFSLYARHLPIKLYKP